MPFLWKTDMKRHALYHLSRDEIIHLAEQYIHNKRYRDIFIDRYCDGLTIDELSEVHQYEYRYIQDLMKECMKDVLKHI